MIKEKAGDIKAPIETVVTSPASNNNEFLDIYSYIEDENKDLDIKVDFLDGDVLIIDKSLDVANIEFDALELNVNDILENLSIENSSDLSINSTQNELFKTSSLNKVNNQMILEDLLISFSKDDLNQDKSFIF